MVSRLTTDTLMIFTIMRCITLMSTSGLTPRQKLLSSNTSLNTIGYQIITTFQQLTTSTIR